MHFIIGLFVVIWLMSNVVGAIESVANSIKGKKNG